MHSLIMFVFGLFIPFKQTAIYVSCFLLFDYACDSLDLWHFLWGIRTSRYTLQLQPWFKNTGLIICYIGLWYNLQLYIDTDALTDTISYKFVYVFISFFFVFFFKLFIDDIICISPFLRGRWCIDSSLSTGLQYFLMVDV